MTSKRIETISGIVIIIIVSILIYVKFNDIENFLLSLPPTLRGLIFFMLSFIGAISVIIPIPYTAVIFLIVSRLPNINPIEVAFFGGLGSALGEILGWIFGRLITNSVSENSRKKAMSLMKLVSSKGKFAVPIAIFLFALTPLPDDILFIGLGLINYSLIEAIIPCIIGKVFMLYIIAFFGISVGTVSRGNDLITTLLATLFLIIIVLFVFKIDWEKYLRKNKIYKN